MSLKFNTLALSVFCVAYGVVVRCGTSPALKVRLVYSPLVPIGSLCQWKIPDIGIRGTERLYIGADCDFPEESLRKTTGSGVWGSGAKPRKLLRSFAAETSKILNF